MSLLDGKVAVVVGCGPGLGRESALALARHGADVVVAARSESTTTAIAAEIEALGRRALPVRCDITVDASCDALAARVEEEFGRADVLVNNAFVEAPVKPVLDASLDSYEAMFDTNFFGAIRTVRSLAPLLSASGDGRVININTLQSIWVRPGFGGYAASKAALASMTKTLARELGPKGIRVNGIHPGLIWSPVAEAWLHQKAEKRGVTYEEEYQATMADAALGYLPDAAEIAGSVVFLASELARPLTGQWWVVDSRYMP